MPPFRSRTLTAITSAMVLALTSVGVAACTPTPTPTPSSNPGGNGNPGSDAVGSVTQERVDAAVKGLPASIKKLMADTGVPGLAIAVVYQGKTVFAEGYGVRSLETKTSVDPNTVFQLASVSKSVGATVIAAEVGKGTVAWDTPLIKNLPDFALADPWVTQHVTIADMYTHRSGLPNHAGDELEDLGYDRAEVLNRLRLAPLAEFRAADDYTNFGLTAAAESVAKAAGLDWASLSERDLYQPLGMTSTSSRYADFAARDDRAVGHVLKDGTWQVTTQQRQPDAQSAAGGVSSSVIDMASWMKLVLAGGTLDGKPLLAKDALVPAITGQFASKPAKSADARSGMVGYGFNVGITAGGLTSLSHSGAFALGAGTAFTMLPSQGLGIVVLTNGSPVGLPETITAEFMDLAQFGTLRQDWSTLYKGGFAPLMAPVGELAGKPAPTNPAAAKPLGDYAGTYNNAYYGPAKVTVVGDHLELVVGPAAVVWPLKHWDGDVFTYAPSNENATPGTVGKATFSGSTLVLELMEAHGLGTFTR